MAQIGQIKILEDEAAKLSLLAQYVNNPKLIEQLEADIKRLNGLSVDEEKKAADARLLIAEHRGVLDALKVEEAKNESFVADLSAREEALKKAKELHAANVVSTASLHAENIKEIERQKNVLAAESKAQTASLESAKLTLANKQLYLDSQNQVLTKERQRVSAIEQEALAAKALYEKKVALIRA